MIWLSLPSSRRVGQRGGLNSGPKGAPAQGGAWGKGVGRARLAGLARCCADSHFGGRLRERGAATRAGQADPGYVTRAHPSLPSAHEISPPQPARIVPTTVVGALPSRLRLPLCSDEGKHIKSIHVATTPARGRPCRRRWQVARRVTSHLWRVQAAGGSCGAACGVQRTNAVTHARPQPASSRTLENRMGGRRRRRLESRTLGADRAWRKLRIFPQSGSFASTGAAPWMTRPTRTRL